MKVESHITIIQYTKKTGKYLGMSSFFVFQIFTQLMINFGGNDLLMWIYTNPHAYILVVLGLIEWGYFSADRAITEYINSNEHSLDLFSVIAIPFFVKITLITEVIYFQIGIWAPFEQHIEYEAQRELLHKMLLEAQLFSLGTLVSTGIFFYGKKIWKNIRKRDLIFDQQESITN